MDVEEDLDLLDHCSSLISYMSVWWNNLRMQVRKPVFFLTAYEGLQNSMLVKVSQEVKLQIHSSVSAIRK
jgi:hypothetical protein